MRIIINLYYNGRLHDAQVITIDPKKQSHTPVAVDCTYLVNKLLKKGKP